MSDATHGVSVVTGVTSGLGSALFAQLAAEGGPVIAVSRPGPRALAVVDEVTRETNNPSLHLVEADLSLLADVRRTAVEIGKICRAADAEIGLLVLNAATLTKKLEVTVEGHDIMWSVNFLGVAGLVFALEKELRKSPHAHICAVSSDAHRWVDEAMLRTFLDGGSGPVRLSPLKLYGVTKLAGLVFFHQLAQEWPEVKITAHHPGFVSTNLGMKGSWPLRLWWRLSRWRMRDPAEAAAELLAVGDSAEPKADRLRYWEKDQAHPLPTACDSPDLAEALFKLPARR